uniref:C2H2-type domain-containing protein n=1 Tax=Macrostomum lignano TaxID=282301 RepID=A0A1I8HX04_9PLAT
CICGRVFHTVRRPGNSVRPSTLADARRHVMGVHARISHEMLTTCCQPHLAENNWHLYADEMLLRLANERPAKASTNFASAPRSLDDSALSNQNSRLDESGCGPGEDSCSMLTGESQQRGDDAGKKQQQPEFSSLLYSSHPVWPGETGKLLNRPGLIADSEHRAAASSPTASPAGASSAGGLSTSTPTMLGGGLGRSEPPIQPHEVATQEQRLASLRVLEEEGELERAVELPYSFRRSAACDSETMEILREKMEYYSTYKVACRITSGCFRCSGCSASSPHGMGDIRKHILGVHAKVPDRFKTACLHASRLSRDDNRLLPDPLLIQLARLKWKGTVGPNEEKLGRGGAATEALSAVSSAAAVSAAAAASTASYDAAFPSMVPLRPARAASPRCRLPRPPAASRASPNKGLRIKIKTTGAGSDQELVTSVASADEPGEDAEDSTSSSAGVPPEMQCSSPTTCFVIQADESEKPLRRAGASSPAAGASSAPTMLAQSGATSCATTCAFPGTSAACVASCTRSGTTCFRHHLLEHPQREFHLLQYSAYRYAMNRVDVKPS